MEDNKMEVNLTVNGSKRKMNVDERTSLLEVLRDHFQLMGTKNGCNQGHCGACTVILNGKAVKACLMRPKKFDNADILTIEGISPKKIGEKVHPIQQAFIDATAVQCGFCTAGYIMELYALFEENIDASKDEIEKVLEGHLCRCTGYKPILDAALLAQQYMKEK